MHRLFSMIGFTALLHTVIYAGGDIQQIQTVTPQVIVQMDGEANESHKWYMGTGIGIGGAKTQYYGTDTVGSLSINVGYEMHRYLDVEARLYLSVKDGSSLRHSYTAGLFLKPKFPVTKKIKVYGLIGYGQTKLMYVGSFFLLNDTTTQHDWMYGIGMGYKLNNHWEMYADITRLIDKSAVTIAGSYAAKVDMLTIGFNYKF